MEGVRYVISARGVEASLTLLEQRRRPERATAWWGVQSLNEEPDTNTSTRIGMLMGTGLLLVSISAASAFDCPNTYKAVMAYYDKAANVAG